MENFTIRQLRNIMIIGVLMIVSPFEVWSFDEWADTVSISTSINLKQNEIGNFEIFLTNDNPVAGMQITFTYDSTIGFDITEANATSRISDFEPPLFVKISDDPANVQIKVLLYSLNGTLIAPGNGTILKFAYQTTPTGRGETILDFLEEPESVLGDLKAFPILLDTSDGKASFVSGDVYTISGKIQTDNGEAIPNVVIDGFSENPVTDDNGFYKTTVGSGWSGVVTPKKAGYTFVPISREYSDILANYEDQNYIGTPEPCLNRVVCNGDFDQDFMYWWSTDNAAIVAGRSDQGIQVSHDEANSDVFQFMKPDPVLENNVFPVGMYQLTAWCLAGMGEDCGVYLGDANTWYNAPAHEQEVTKYVPGTGAWQKIDVLLTLSKPEILSVYLYASKPGSTVVYDDVTIEYLPECPEKTLCNGDFEHSLVYWASTDNAAIVPGKTGQEIAISHDDANSDVFQFMNGVFEANITYNVSAWCLADVGEDCGIYLGDANTHYNLPAHEREVSHYIPGTGEWQNISAMLTLSEAEMLSVYLYASKPDSTVVYDDVNVEAVPTPACADRSICNGDFEQGLAYWWDIGNASLTYGRTGWGVQIAHDDANSDAFQFMNGIFEAGKIYQVSVWCLADVGEECGLYLGDANTYVNPPAHEREVSAYLPGNGAWQQVMVTLPLDEPERLSVYLYAYQTGSTVVYDDVELKDVTPYYAYLAEGYTNLGFKTYLTLFNPNSQDAHVNVDFLREDGSVWPYPITLQANSRRVIDASVLVPDQGFSTKVESDLPLAVERSMYWPAGGTANADGHATLAMSALNTTWYLAEGYVSSDFNTYILLVNPHAEQVGVNVTFLLEDGTSFPYSRTLPPTSRQTIDVSALIASGGFSTRIEADQPIMAERTMYWTAGGVAYAGGHNTIALSDPAQTWYLAEGYNSSNFQTYIMLMNPNSNPANATITFMKEDGSTVPYSRALPPNSRQTIITSAIIPTGGFATKVAADAPILVERAMYWGAGGVPRAGGHNTTGISTLATTWYLAEGYVGGSNNFQTYILLFNPNPVEANIAVNFIKDDGTTVPYSRTIPARSRSTITAKSIVPSGGFATKVSANVPILVERAMYWDVDGVAQGGGHCSVGIPHRESRMLIVRSSDSESFTSYKLTVITAGNGGGRVHGDRIDCGSDCSEVYVDGTVLYLKAEPDVGSTFSGWLINGEQVAGTIEVHDDMTVTAIFDTP